MTEFEIEKSAEFSFKKKIIILNPPLFSHDGRLSLGQAISGIFVDILSRYSTLLGKEVVCASKSFNAQGKPADARLDANEKDLKTIPGKVTPILEELIKKMEIQKSFLGFAESENQFIDYDPEVRKSSQEVFLALWSGGMLKRIGRKFYLSRTHIEEICDVDKAIENINFYPNSLKQNFRQIFKDTQNTDLEVTKERIFATPLPIHICEHCQAVFPSTTPLNVQGELDPRQIKEVCSDCHKETNNSINDTISPLFDLTTQANFLKIKQGVGYSIMVSGRNVLARYPYQTFLIGLAFDGKSPFDALVVHSLLGTFGGKRMSNTNMNVVFVEDVIKRYPNIHADAIRYALIKSVSQNSNISIYNPDLLDSGQKFVYKVGNLRKFFKKNNCSFLNLHPNKEELSDFIKFMESFDLKSAFLWAEVYLKNLSLRIKTENDTKGTHDLKRDQQEYTNALWMLESFMPTIVIRSKDDLGLIF